VDTLSQTEYDISQRRLAERRKIAQQMMFQQMQGMQQPTQVVSGQAVRTNPLAALANMASMFMANQQMQGADAEETALAQRRAGDISSAIGRFNQETAPQTGHVGPMGPEPAPITMQPSASDKSAAAMRLMQSTGNPAQIAQMIVANAMKGQEPFSLREGEKRFGPGGMVAENPKAPAFSTTPHFTGEGAGFVLDTQGNVKPLPQGVTPREKVELAPSGVAYNPFATRPGTVLPDPNKLMNLDPLGNATVNQPLVGAKKEIAAAGATKIPVNVNTEKTLLGNIADKVADQVAAGTSQAQASVGTLRNLEQLNAALDSGKITTGPGAGSEIFVRQVAEKLGVGGKDNAEILANTRSAMQSLAKQELSAAELMKGQGQITENERKLIARAAGGDITMTEPELRALSGTLEKAARWTIQRNASNVQNLGQNPNASVLMPFMTVPEPQRGAPTLKSPEGWIDMGGGVRIREKR
jgi:hypothetical protein